MNVRIVVGLAVAAVPFLACHVRGQARDENPSEQIGSSVKAAPGGRVADVDRVAEAIIARANQFRRDNKVAPLAPNARLTAAARAFADFMARTGKYGHTADGSTPADRASKHGYDSCIVLENIAYQYSSAGFESDALAGGFAAGWEKSPGHRRNLLDPDVSVIGVAVARSADTGYYYAVQMFGRPKSDAIEFQLANESDAEVRYKIADEEFTLAPRFVRTHMRCRPEEVAVELPGGAHQTLKPRSGDRFIIDKSSDSYRVRPRR